jgi:hypothetical protein
MRSSNHRASLALLLGLLGAAAVPVSIGLAHRTAGVKLLDAVWAIPFAAGCSLAALLLVRGARGRIRSTLERAGGLGRIRTGRILAVLGICFALSASIAVGFYELLIRLEG